MYTQSCALQRIVASARQKNRSYCPPSQPLLPNGISALRSNCNSHLILAGRVCSPTRARFHASWRQHGRRIAHIAHPAKRFYRTASPRCGPFATVAYYLLVKYAHLALRAPTHRGVSTAEESLILPTQPTISTERHLRAAVQLQQSFTSCWPSMHTCSCALSRIVAPSRQQNRTVALANRAFCQQLRVAV